MVTILKKGATKKNITKLLEKLMKEFKPSGIDVYEYLGKIKLKDDPIAIQKELRNEWE